MPASRWRRFVPRSRAYNLGLALVLLALAAGCAPRALPPITPGAPQFPDFVFPTIPPELSGSGAGSDHQQAWFYLQAGDTRQATRGFSAALKRLPSFYPAEVGLGYVDLAGRDYGRAMAWFDRALSVAPAYAPGLVGRGEALLAQQREADALQAFEAALTAEPSLTSVRRRVEVLRFRNVQESVEAARQAAAAGRVAEARQAYTRAIAASPDSAFLHRELALLERGSGAPDAALLHARRALELDSSDARALTLIGEIQESRGEFATALKSYTDASAIEPSEALDVRIRVVREALELSLLPPEFRSINSVPAVSRGQLAALLGVRLRDLLRTAPSRGATVITDTRNHWAASWIMTASAAGILEVYPNHTFQPDASVRRGDFADAISRVLTIIGNRNPAIAQDWQRARIQFADLAPGHLSYAAAARSVAAGILPQLAGGVFQLGRLVSGAEATQAIERLQALAARANQSGARVPASPP